MNNKKTAFITGAAMGMGACKARMLADKDWQVFAGVLPGADTSQLTQHDNIIPVEQDVTRDDSIAASVRIVEKELAGHGLNLLINNAGIANIATGVIEGMSIEDAHKLFEVNLWGMVRVVQSFLPFIREAAPHARIINFASGAVKVNPVGSGAYNMSKHAVVGLTRTLRHELAPFGVQVTAVEPGAVKTHMTANSRETTKEVWRNVSDEMNEIYGPYHRKGTTEVLPDMIENNGNEPDYVAAQVVGLLDKKQWKPSYMVGKDVRFLGIMHKILPERAFEKILRRVSKIETYKG